MDITKEIEKLFSKSAEQDLNKLSTEELDKLVNSQIHDLDFKGMSTSERDALKDKIERGRAILHSRHEGKAEVSRAGEKDTELANAMRSSLGMEPETESIEVSKESDIKVEGGEPKTNKARFKAIKKKKQPSPETTEVEEDEGAVPPTNIAGSY